MICAYCKSNIDDDSLYCDQCGREILICPKCNKLGKGKVCTFDGTPLVSIKNKTAAVSTEAVIPKAVTSPDLKSVTQVTDIGELHLVNKNLGLDLKIEDGDVIGREMGRFMNIFSKHQTVSGKHAQFKLNPDKGWTVTDLDSTNGTKYNNVSLKPMQPEILSDKSYLRIANIEFYVQIMNKGPASKTGTQRI